jgi:hypothetical protein
MRCATWPGAELRLLHDDGFRGRLLARRAGFRAPSPRDRRCCEEHLLELASGLPTSMWHGDVDDEQAGCGVAAGQLDARSWRIGAAAPVD